MAETTGTSGMMSRTLERKPRVLIVGTEFDFSREPRIIQEILALGDDVELYGAGKGSHPSIKKFLDHTENRSLVDRVLDKLLIILKYYAPWLLRFRHRKLLAWIDEIKPDVVSTHHLESAYIVLDKSNYLTFNSHEYIPRMYDGSFLWRWTKGWLIRRTMPAVLKKSKVMFVESEAVSRNYSNAFLSVPEVAIIPNATRERRDIKPVLTNKAPIKLVHHGIASPGRGLEMMIEAARKLGDKVTLSLYLVGSEHNINQLKNYAAGAQNVIFKAPVLYDKIVDEMNQYDIGVCMFRSSNYHTLYTTVPNKFWEYLTARVVPLVWDKSAMAEVLNAYKIGLQAQENSVQGIIDAVHAVTLNEINEQKQKIDANSGQFSAEVLIDPVLRRYIPGLSPSVAYNFKSA
jgi:glycosyltransferase involved in cell wall biosynthesis